MTLLVRHVKGDFMNGRVVIALFALGIALTGHAGHSWPPIGGAFVMPDGGKATVTVDPNSLNKSEGETWTINQKTVFETPQKAANDAEFRSELAVYAYDCASNRAARISYARYSSANGTGPTVDEIKGGSPADYQWKPTEPGTVLESFRKTVCMLRSKVPHGG